MSSARCDVHGHGRLKDVRLCRLLNIFVTKQDKTTVNLHNNQKIVLTLWGGRMQPLDPDGELCVLTLDSFLRSL